MTAPDPVELASLMCSRLCHDLLSPVGAMTNGLELLADETDPEMRERCLELLAQSARTSADKLKFFRLAYGAAGGFGDRVPVEEPRAAIEALVGDNKRIEVRWALAVDSLPKPAVKVLLNLAHIAIDSLIRGGVLDIGAERNEGASEIVVRASAPRIAFDDTVGEALQGDLSPRDLSGRTAPAWMIATMAQQLGGSIQFHRAEDALLMGAVLPEGEGMIG